MPKTRKLFFGAEVWAPWPQVVPGGRVVSETSRHLTLAFLGEVDWEAFEPRLRKFPKIPTRVGPVGRFDRCLFLPPGHPQVVAWQIEWSERPHLMGALAGQIMDWLRPSGYSFDGRQFLSHVTMARAPFKEREWTEAFVSLPVIVRGLHLYESKGGLTYVPVWSHPIVPPIEEIEHTADIAFVIRGDSLPQLQVHAQTALAMICPSLLAYFDRLNVAGSFEELIGELNHLIAIADAQEGCSFKAVSYCGEIEDDAPGVLRWEMIVDV